MTPLYIGFMSINILGHDISAHYGQEKSLFTLYKQILMFNYRHDG